MFSKPGAIIIGGHYQGLGTLKSLGEKNVSLCLLDNQLHIGRFSRYAKRFYKCPHIKYETSFLDCLKGLATEENLQGWVVFPTDDETVYVLSKHKTELEQYYSITTPHWNTTKYAYNKKLTYELAIDLGISIPKTYFPENIEDISKFDLSFPLVVKPAVVKKFYNVTKQKVFVANNELELKEQYKQACKVIPPSEILLQEYIPGGTEYQYSYCAMFKNGKALSSVTARRSRQHPMDFGHASTFVETVNIPQLEQIGTKFLTAINYYGIAEVEYKQDPRDGEYKLLEINPRIWGWHTISRKSGVSLTYLLFEDIIGNEINTDGFKEGIKWIRLTTDIPLGIQEILKGNLKLKDYVRSLQGQKEFAVLSIKDPLPIIMEWLLLPYFLRKKGF